MKKTIFSLAALAMLSITSCGNDDEATTTTENNGSELVIPTTYTFEREGATSVSYGGQTTRLMMGREILSALKDNTKTAEQIKAMYDHQEGAADFADAELNASSKNLRGKTAASADFFSDNATEAAEIKAKFDAYIDGQVDEVFPNWDVTAAPGVAGKIGSRYVNAKGLEYDQAFNKGLIGALCADQILNGYLSDTKLNVENDALEDGKNYTKMEHHWDEGYGYLYGDGDNDKFLFKYVKKYPEQNDAILAAFIKGRAAIVAKDYNTRDEQVAIIRDNVSMVIALRTIHYLEGGKEAYLAGDMETAFHDLSEGYGFIESLRFTRKSDMNASYATKANIDMSISILMDGNGFWDLDVAGLDQVIAGIKMGAGIN